MTDYEYTGETLEERLIERGQLVPTTPGQKAIAERLGVAGDEGTTFEQDLIDHGFIEPKRPPNTGTAQPQPAGDAYLSAAVRGETDRVRTAQPGTRNDTLFKAAARLGELVAGAHLDETLAINALTDAANTAGLEQPEIGKTVASGLRAGAEQPRGPQQASVTVVAAMPSKVRSRLLTRAQLADLPQPEPLITDTIDKRTVVVLSGRRAKGKSFVALDWSLCAATGKPWQSRAVQRQKVLWVAAEGAYGLHRRVDAWERAWKHDVEHFTVLPMPVNLYTGKHFEEFLDVAKDIGAGLVVFDTWARCTVGGSENDNSDATVACDRLEALRELGATSVIIAHTDSDDTKTRGATALEDNVDIVYRLRGEPDHLVMSRTKRKDGHEHDEHHLKLSSHAQSVVVESQTVVDMSGRTAELMSIYVQHFVDTGCTKKELRDVAAENGITSSGTFTRAINALISSGELVNTGSDVRPYYKTGTTK